MPQERATPRRTNGARTRERLLGAARHLLAADDGEVTLRAITSAAEANVAAVSYHFGSKDELCRTVVVAALRAVVDDQLARYGRLGPGATLEQLAVAFVEPVVEGLTGADADGRALLRIAARAAIAEPADHAGRELARATATLREHLGHMRPDLDELEVGVRVEASSALLRSYADGPLGVVLAGEQAVAVERLLVAAVLGAWSGAPA